MEEVVDRLVDFVERKLEQIGIELTIEDVEEIRNTLDVVLAGHDKE